ncbi:MAG: MMPL family transporter, partial [Planctomycetota bacterium]
DAGTPDAGTPDAGTPDAGTPDAGTPDAGTPDAGTPDAGTPDAVPAAVSQAIHASGAGNLTAAISSAIAFYAALFTDFQGLAELGLIAGTGVLLCLLATLLVLPALLVRFDRGAAPRALPSLRWLEPVVRRPWPTLGLVLVLCGVALPAALRGLRFEEDLLSLQSREEEAVEWEMRLMERDLSSWITVERVPTLAAAAKLQADFAALDSRVVASAESAAMFLGPQVEARRARLHALAEELGPPPAAPDAALDPARLKAALGALAEALGEASEGALRAEGAPQDAVARLLALQERFEQLAAAPLDAAAQGAAQERLLTAFQARVAKLRALLTPKGWTPETLPAPIRDHFIGSDGSFGVYVSPRENVWDPVAMARFLGEVRKVAPGVTGSTVAVYESTAVLRGAFHRATLITVVAILLLLLLDFRDRAALLSLVPLGVGCLWLGGAMGALGVPFNMANFFTVPVLLGLGIDSGVHIMNHERSGSRTPVLQDMTAAAVTLSLLTTSVSFGSLAISGHKGMASIGHVMVLGALLVLAASLVVLPALNRLLAPQPAP